MLLTSIIICTTVFAQLSVQNGTKTSVQNSFFLMIMFLLWLYHIIFFNHRTISLSTKPVVVHGVMSCSVNVYSIPQKLCLSDLFFLSCNPLSKLTHPCAHTCWHTSPRSITIQTKHHVFSPWCSVLHTKRSEEAGFFPQQSASPTEFYKKSFPAGGSYAR